MSTDDLGNRRLPRRELIRLAGLGGLTIAAASVVNPIPLSALAASADDETPEGFLAWAYAQRAGAMTSGDLKLLDALYDPANSALLAHERSRAGFFHGGGGFDGRILGYESALSLVDLKVSGAAATARLEEALRITWIPRPQAIPAWVEKLRAKEPDRYAPSPRGPRGEIVSAVGNRHEVTLVKGSKGWQVAQDAYQEAFGLSPDAVRGSWAAPEYKGGPSMTGAIVPASSGSVTPMATYTYNRSNAKGWAQTFCDGHSSLYCWFDPCGGDCANFVSQCLHYGNQVTDSQWKYTENGNCYSLPGCQGQTARTGTTTWIRANELKNWITGVGRADTNTSCGLGSATSSGTTPTPLMACQLITWRWLRSLRRATCCHSSAPIVTPASRTRATCVTTG